MWFPRVLLSLLLCFLTGFALAPAALAKAPYKPITILVTNATEVAEKHEGALLVGIASLFTDVEDKVLDEIVTQMGPALQTHGVQAVVGKVSLTVTPQDAQGFYLWNAQAQTLAPAVVTEGTYRGVQVTITNADAMVKQQRGGATLLAAKMLAVDVSTKVNQLAGGLILEELGREGVNAMVAF